MRPIRFLRVCPLAIAGLLLCGDDAHAQGLLQRLRGRIEAAIPAPRPETSDKTNRPARPVEGTNSRDRRPDAASQQAQPAARYRLPAGSPSNTGTPDNTDSEYKTDPSDTFGKSILAPLDFDEPPQGDIESMQGATIGIKAVQANPGYPAVQITGIAPYSQAAKQGLRIGDYIFSIDGIATPTVNALIEYVSTRQPGQNVRLRFGRAGQVRDIEITLVAKPGTQASSPSPMATLPMPPQPSDSNRAEPREPALSESVIGAELQNAAGRRGVIVTGVLPNSIASRAGLTDEDRIVSVEGKLVTDVDAMARLLAQRGAEKTTAISVIRDNQLVTATLDLTSLEKDPQLVGGNLAAPSAAAGSAVSNDANDGTATTGQGSLVGGLGSMIGGLFSQKSTAAPEFPSANRPVASAIDQDPLALDLETLPPAAPAEVQTKPNQDPAIRAEIERLREQLKALEARLVE